MMQSGVFNILIASVFFSIINALVKYLDDIPAVEIVFFRALVSFIISFWVVKRAKIKIFNQYSNILFARGITGAVALCMYFYTIQNMPLATAVTILYLAPIFTVLFAVVLVKEKPNKWQYPFMLLSLIGAGLMKNFDPRVSITHFALGIAAAVFAGLAYNCIRMLKGKVSPNLIILYFPMITIPICIPWLLFTWKTPNPLELAGLIAVGISTQIAQYFMTRAYLLEPAAKISHFNYLTVVYAFLTGIFLFEESINTLSIIGLVLVFVGIILSSKFAKKTQ